MVDKGPKPSTVQRRGHHLIANAGEEILKVSSGHWRPGDIHSAHLSSSPPGSYPSTAHPCFSTPPISKRLNISLSRQVSRHHLHHHRLRPHAFYMTFVLMMESTYRDLATRTLQLLEKSENYRVIILLIGAPGSGKSTIAQRVVDILNEQHKTKGTHHPDKVIHGGDLVHANDDLPEFDPQEEIDVEDENYTPTRQSQGNSQIIRGRGGDDTALKITYNDTTNSTNNTDAHDSTFAQVIPMDGFHLPRRVLHQFSDSATAVLRRGSPFTFDSSLIVRLVSTLNHTLAVSSEGLAPLDTTRTDIPDIYIPSFDHAEHDPKQYGTRIHASARVVIMEGLYLLLDDPVWGQIAKCLEPGICREELDQNAFHVKTNDVSAVPVPDNKSHEFWKILIEDEKMLQRVGKRHVKAGIVKTLEDGEERVKINDLPNGKRVYKESFRSDLNIISIDDANEV